MTDPRSFRDRALALGASVVAVWAAYLLGLASPALAYELLALVPRRVDGLPGILGMPFIHDSWTHLFANTVPLLVFGGLLLIRGVRYYLGVVLAVALIGGLALWTFGRDAAHIGASGVVFGLFGFLVTRGFYERSLGSVVIAVAVAFAYGGMVWVLLLSIGSDNLVSWDGHLCGLVAGIVAARGAFAIERRRSASQAGLDA